MARRSYLPAEVHWGHQFAQIVMKPAEGSEDTHYTIDLNRWVCCVFCEGGGQALHH